MEKNNQVELIIEDMALNGHMQSQIAYAILRCAYQNSLIATHLKYLGNGDAATTMGAIEAASVRIAKSLDGLAEATEMVAREICEKD